MFLTNEIYILYMYNKVISIILILFQNDILKQFHS